MGLQCIKYQFSLTKKLLMDEEVFYEIFQGNEHLQNDYLQVLANNQQYLQNSNNDGNIYQILNLLYEVQVKKAKNPQELNLVLPTVIQLYNNIYQSKQNLKQKILQDFLLLTSISQFETQYIEQMFCQIKFYQSNDYDIYYKQLQFVFSQYSSSILVVNLIKDQSFVNYCIKNNQRSTPKVFEKFYHILQFLEEQYKQHEQMRINLLEIVTQWCFLFEGHIKSLVGVFNEAQLQTLQEYQQGIIASSFQEKTVQLSTHLQQQQCEQYTEQQLTEIQLFLKQYPQIQLYTKNHIHIILDHAICVCISFLIQTDIKYIQEIYAFNFLSEIINGQVELSQYILLQLYSTNDEIQYQICQKLFMAAFANPSNTLSVSKNSAIYLGALLSYCKWSQQRSCSDVMIYLKKIIQESFNYINLNNLQYADKKAIIAMKTYIFCLSRTYWKITLYSELLEQFYEWIFDKQYQPIFKYCLDELDIFLQTMPYEFIEKQENEMYNIISDLQQQKCCPEELQCNFSIFQDSDTLLYYYYSNQQLD